MSRKSDLALAWRAAKRDEGYDADAALEAAYLLGRATQAEKDAKYMSVFSNASLTRALAKRLRAKVRKQVER